MAFHNNEQLFETMKDVGFIVWESSDGSNFSQPRFYRELTNRGEDFSEIFEKLLSGKLQLNVSAVAGKGLYENHFFCASLSDEELPWDTTEIDW
ncbi:hypothetical protein BOTCAL_0638g00050 [Botryotinia calthae]|uniref:Uncharacterized protein n=1 Tax=Botryotinia calthae TaxID=38488 RepID=A0A4Y8CI62_9HELO|nr:hypothetical protein BOTCAL_0638g00050 [Botryotinia calthae]